MRSPTKSAGIIPYFKKGNQHHFLCIKHQKGHRGFPKGGVENEETDIETATREFREETGLTTIQIHPSTTFIEQFPVETDGKLLQKTVIFFLGEISETEIKNIQLQKEEMADYKIGTYEEIQNTLTHPGSKETLKHAFSYLQ